MNVENCDDYTIQPWMISIILVLIFIVIYAGVITAIKQY